MKDINDLSNCKNARKKLSGRAQIRYEKLISAATEAFLEKGFGATNMQEIVRRSGGSLATAYKFFGSKEELFAEILLLNTKNIFVEIKDHGISYNKNLEEFLYDIGEKFLNILHNNEKAYIFHRFIVYEGHKDNARLGKIFFENAMKNVSHVLKEYLGKEKAKGTIDVEDTELAAYQFFHVVKEPLFFGKVLGLNTDEQLFDREKALRQSVKIFSKGLAKN